MAKCRRAAKTDDAPRCGAPQRALPPPKGPKYLHSKMEGFCIRNKYYDLGKYLP